MESSGIIASLRDTPVEFVEIAEFSSVKYFIDLAVSQFLAGTAALLSSVGTGHFISVSSVIIFIR